MMCACDRNPTPSTLNPIPYTLSPETYGIGCRVDVTRLERSNPKPKTSRSEVASCDLEWTGGRDSGGAEAESTNPRPLMA